jgi:GT2 family glycosyltransferase
MTVEVSIAIVLYNSADSLSECLHSVRAAVEEGWAELIAVDNASPDDSVEILRRELGDARLISSGENRGFAAGANEALTHAQGRYWLLLNPDVRVPTSGLQTLVQWMDAHEQLAAASPDIYSNDGHWESPGRAAPSVLRGLLELSRLHRLLPRGLRGEILRGPYWPGGDQIGVGWVPGTAMLVRPDAARQVGMLREDLFMYGEDVEWCWRMRRGGWQIGVCATTTFLHDTSSSARRSWSATEKERRIAAGIDAACRRMYRGRHARLLAAVSAAALELESRAPGRDQAHRERVRQLARTWWELATQR